MKSFLRASVALTLAGAVFSACGGDGSRSASPSEDAGSDAEGSGGTSSGGQAADSGALPDSGPSADGGSGGGAGSDAGDGVAPTISLTGPSEVIIDCGTTYVDPGASASDATDGAVDVLVSGVTSIDTSAPGTFTVTYTAVDGAGNEATLTRAVHVCGAACGDLGKVDVDLRTWKVEQYHHSDASQGNANWVVAQDGLSVTQANNSDASILLSDFDTQDLAFEGTWQMDGNSDDDYVGFVFGYQDRGHYYLFDWKRGQQSYQGAIAEAGMNLKIVDLPGLDSGADRSDASLAAIEFTAFDLWGTIGNAKVRQIKDPSGNPYFEPVPWQFNTPYRFFFEFHSGRFGIRVIDPQGTVLVDWDVQDTTYPDGKFGFYNYSQGPVQYQSFTTRETPLACTTLGQSGLDGGAPEASTR